jgi:hypothetical protein
MQQKKQITLEDIQRDKVLSSSIVEKCDLIINCYFDIEKLKKENDELKKEIEKLKNGKK